MDVAVGAGLADELIRACGEHYGTAIREFLTKLVAIPREQVRESVKQLHDDFVKAMVPAGADGQAARVARRFALVAAGGEMATKLGITGWEQGEAIRAAETCFRAWLANRGGAGSQEVREALSQVRHFLESHGEGRFTDLDGTTDRVTANRAGFRRKGDGGRTEYFISREVFQREVCVGLDHKFVARTLRDARWLVVDEVDRLTVSRKNLPGIEDRVYLVRPRNGGET